MSQAEFLFLRQRPAPPLDGEVESLWIARGRIPYDSERILPTGKVVLIFNLGAPHAMARGDAPDAGWLNRKAWICGQQSGYLLNRPLAETDVVGITFRPAGAARFLGLPLWELAERTIEAEQILGARAESLRQRLAETPAPRDRFALLEAFLIALRRPVPRNRALVGEALRRLLAPEPPPLYAISRDLEVSHKHLIAETRTLIGLPPKALARIARFNGALRAFDHGRPVAWERVALDCGYYDQPHFNREFRAFAGATPGDYLALRRRHLGPALNPAEDANFLPLPVAA